MVIFGHLVLPYVQEYSALWFYLFGLPLSTFLRCLVWIRSTDPEAVLFLMVDANLYTFILVESDKLHFSSQCTANID